MRYQNAPSCYQNDFYHAQFLVEICTKKGVLGCFLLVFSAFYDPKIILVTYYNESK